MSFSDAQQFLLQTHKGEKHMTNREMMEIAMRQSAEDMGCRVEDFKADKNVVVPIKLGKKARTYLKEPITCNLVSYGNNIMAASIPETMDLVSAYVDKFEFYHCFETPNMHWLNERLAEKGHKICFMAEHRCIGQGHLYEYVYKNTCFYGTDQLYGAAADTGREILPRAVVLFVYRFQL